MQSVNNNLNIRTTPLTTSVATPTAATVKSQNAGSVASILSQATNLPQVGSSRTPELSQPSFSITPEVTEMLNEYLLNLDPKVTQELSAFSNNVEAGVDKVLQTLAETQAEQGKPLDISGLSSPAVALIVAANLLMLSVNKADTALGNKLSLVSYDATKNTAASMIREGMNLLTSSISQGALQLTVTAAGANSEFKGLKNERSALKNNASKLDALGSEAASLQDILQKPATLNAVGELDALTAQSRASMSSRLQDIELEIKNEGLTLSDSQIKARSDQTLGDAVMRNAPVVGNLAGSAGQYAATLDRSDQQISQASSRVATAASEESKESGRKDLSLIQELLRILENINQSHHAAMSAIAGNIRA
ncbi:IpaC/SipC family type III secretion system effector [Dryocola sp. BD626]|uniref:IpaC/SipC family type III secretion system effector n=1 Tax=Dryocola sp. BD626 TaxID=3133273 RepID=UPI003F504C5D